jgi:hypothetical protein
MYCSFPILLDEYYVDVLDVAAEAIFSFTSSSGSSNYNSVGKDKEGVPKT